jgi:hypothetical protein
MTTNLTQAGPSSKRVETTDKSRRGIGGQKTVSAEPGKPLKRELKVNGAVYVLTIADEGLKLVSKGKRKGIELKWSDLVSGDAALAVALNASLGRTADVGARGKSSKR